MIRYFREAKHYHNRLNVNTIPGELPVVSVDNPDTVRTISFMVKEEDRPTLALAILGDPKSASVTPLTSYSEGYLLEQAKRNLKAIVVKREMEAKEKAAAEEKAAAKKDADEKRKKERAAEIDRLNKALNGTRSGSVWTTAEQLYNRGVRAPKNTVNATIATLDASAINFYPDFMVRTAVGF